MKSILLALRNLTRNRRRSLTTLLAMVIGCNAVLLLGGFVKSITYSLQTSFVQRVGHLQIQHKDYFLFGTGNPGSYGVGDYQRLVQALKTDPALAPMVSVITPALQLGGIAGNFEAGVSRTVLGNGVVASEQDAMRTWNDYQLPFGIHKIGLTGTSPDSATIGLGVARVLQLCKSLKVNDCPVASAGVIAVSAAGSTAELPADVADLAQSARADTPVIAGTRIELLASNPKGAPNVASLNVVEARSQGAKEIDDMFVGLHLQQAQALVYGRDEPKVTAVIVQLKHTNSMEAAKARIDELLARDFKNQPLTVERFTTLYPAYGQTVNMFAAIFGFVTVLIGAIVLFMVGNTMSMAVVERTVEIGTLRAIGIRKGGIRTLFLCEGFLLGVIGTLCGIVTAMLISAAINHLGLTWTPPGQVNPIPLSIRVLGETRMVVVCAMGLIVLGVVSALLPAGRASKKNIVDALRHV